MDYRKESETFNQMADYYDKFRPGYPAEIVDTIIKKAGLSKGSKLLEIGAGSGKATELFTGRSFEIVCIEPGADLAKAGSSKFKNENLRYEIVRFEEYSAAPKNFDIILAAQSFHWVPQPVGYEKCAYTLKDSGYLALIWNMYIVEDNALDNELLRISKKYGGLADYLSHNDCEKRINSITSDIIRSGLFLEPEIVRIQWSQNYTADEYFGFALTGNRFVQKSEDEKITAREELVQLASKHGGIISRPYLCVLYLAKRI